MASMFGGPFGGIPGILGQAVQGSPGPAGPGGGFGGFPGIFPAGGVSNSGFAGLNQMPQAPCTQDDVKSGRCVMGPSPWLS